jgi:hypothetical protein
MNYRSELPLWSSSSALSTRWHLGQGGTGRGLAKQTSGIKPIALSLSFVCGSDEIEFSLHCRDARELYIERPLDCFKCRFDALESALGRIDSSSGTIAG